MGHLNNIQKPLKELEKMIHTFMTILGVAESFKTMNRPDLTWPEPTRP